MTFNEFHKYTAAAAGALYRRGVRKGDVVCVCCPNIMEYGVIFHAIVSLGAVITTVNPLYTAGRLNLENVTLVNEKSGSFHQQLRYYHKMSEIVCRIPNTTK